MYSVGLWLTPESYNYFSKMFLNVAVISPQQEKKSYNPVVIAFSRNASREMQKHQ